MPLALPLPDGRFVTIREGETPEQTWARAQQMYPDAFATKQAPEAPKERSWGEAASDIAASGKAGIGSLLQFPGQMYGLATGDFSPTGLYGYGKELEERGQKEKSAALRGKEEASQARVKEAEKEGQLNAFLTSIGETVKDPALLASFIAEQIPSQLPSLVAGVGTPALSGEVAALRQAAKTLGTKEAKDAALAAAVKKGSAAAVGTGAVQQGADIGTGVYEDMYKKLIEQGASPEAAAQTSLNYARSTGAGAAVISLLAQRLPGARTLEEAFAGKRGATGAITGFGKGLLGEAGSELTEETGGKFLQNLAMRQIDPTQSLTEGLGATAGQAVIGGGLLGGAAGAYSGMRGQGPAKTQEQTDIEQARAEEEARLKKDREYKATPQYQQDVVEQYETLAQQKKDLVGQKKKIEKGSITEDADKSFNRDVELQLKTLQKQIDPLAKDYYQAKSFVTRQEKQAELAGMTPQEYMLQQMGAKPSATKVEPENDYVALATQNKPPKAQPSAAEQYMLGQFQAAQGLVSDLGGYADYMMQDPKMAAQIVQNRLKIPGFTASENNTLLSGIAMRLKGQETAARNLNKQELGQRQADLQAQTLTTPKDQMALFSQSTEDVEKLRAEGETNFDYLDPMFETALAGKPPVVQVSDAIKPTDKAPLIRKQVESLMETADQADKDYQTARSANQPDAARKAFERGNQAIEQIKTVSKEGGDYAREFLAARQAQNSAMAQLSDITEQLRTGQTLGGPNKEMAASTEQSLTNKANQVRAQLVAASLQEAAIHRRAAGNTPITQDEAIKAASVIHDAVNDWVSRSAAKSTQPTYEDVVVQPAQMRADKIVRPAVTERRQVAPGTQAISPAEAKHFQARVLAARNQLIAPPQGLGRRVETGILKRQFSAEEAAKTAEARGETATTLSGELRRLREYVLNKVEKVLQTVDLPEGGARVVGGPDKYGRDERGVLREEGLRELMEQARDVLDTGTPSRELIDSIEAQADRLLRGEDLGTMTVTRTVVTDQGRKVARTREGEEASPVMVNRGRKFGQVAEEEARAPESRYTEELRAGLRAYQQGQGLDFEASRKQGSERLTEEQRAALAQQGFDFAAPGKGVAAEQMSAEERQQLEAKKQRQSVKQTQAQQSLFPETNEEFGYIRATAANFAKSPRMKPVWEALDKARALFKKTEAARAQRSATVRARMREIESLQGRINSITSSAEFIAARQEKWNTEQLAKTFTYEAGDLDLLNKIDALRAAGKYEEAAPLTKAFLERKQARYKDALRTVSEGRRLDDLDNRLLGFMQDTNKEISDAAKVMYEKVAPLRDAVAAIKKAMKTSPTVTAEEKALLAHEDEIKKQRGEYQRATENAIKKAREDMDAARAALLDPLIKQTSDALTKAETTLKKEKQELEKAKASFEGPVEGSPQNKNQLRTYFLFKVEEKQGVIDDLTKQIEEQKNTLEDLVTQRYEEMDGAAAVAQAMLDKNVKTERTWLEMLEAQLAFVRGDDVLKKANSYPFAAERARISAKNQVQVVKAAEKRAEEFKATAKTQQQEMEEFWQDKLGGEGINVARKKISGEQRKAYEKIGADISAQTNKIATLKTALDEKLTQRERTAKETALKKAEEALASLQKEELDFSTRFYEVSKTLTKADKEAKRLHEKGIQSAMRLDEIERRELVKDAQTELLAGQIADRLVELEAVPGANDINELKKVLNSDTATEEEVINAQVRIGLLQEIASLEAQEEVLSEGKPRKKQRPATALSSSALAKGKPLRTGFVQVLEKASEAVRAEKEKGTYGEDRFTGGEDAGESGIFTGGEERFFSRGKPAEGQTVESLKEELRQVMGESVTSRGNVKIYNSVEDYIQQQKPDRQDKLRQEIPPDAKGFAQGDRAVLFAENIGKGHGLGVLLHEIGVHVGFRNFFNEGQYKALVNQVKQWAQRTDGSIEEKVGKAAQRRVEMANTDESQVDDELLAYAVEEAVQMGVNPEGIKGGSALRNWLKMVVAAFKKALNAFGVNPTNLQAGDLVNFAYGCAQLELKGTWHGTGAKFDMFDFAYMGKGEGAQVYSWGTYRAQRKGVAKNYQETEVKDKLLKQWEALPEIKKWQDSLQVRFRGYTAQDFANAKGDLAGVPAKFTRAMTVALREATTTYVENRALNLSPGVILESKLKFALGAGSVQRKEIRAWIETADLTGATGPADIPVYKGFEYMPDYMDEQEALAARRTLRALESPEIYNVDTSKPFAEQVKQVVEKNKNHIENVSLKLSAYENNPKIIKDLKDELAGYKKLDLSAFTDDRLTAPPIPRPEGFMVRTLHTKPEDHYFLWDASLDDQPAYVEKAFKEIIDSFKTIALRDKFEQLLGTAPKGRDFYESLRSIISEDQGFGIDSSAEVTSKLLEMHGIAGTKYFDYTRNRNNKSEATYNYVDYTDKDEGAEIIAHNLEPVGTDKNVILLSRKAKYNNSEFEDASKVTSRIVAQNRSWWDKLKVNFTGLAFETQIVDRFAGFERLAKYMEPLKGTQMMFYLRQYDQRMNLVSDSVANGAPALVEKTRKDGQIERMVESKDGASLSGVVTTLKDAKQYIGNGEAVNQMFTTYLAAIRAANKGIDSLNFGTDKDGKPILTQADLDKITNLVEKNKPLKDIFNKARSEYNEYNRNLIKFLVDTGALDQATANRLVREDDYIPFYRQRGGVAELLIGSESPIYIGSIKEQPYLQELVGGDQPILDFMTSSVQNTNLLLDMGLRNLATKNAVMELVDLKAATLVKKASGPDVVKFKIDGSERYAIMHTEKVKIGNKEFETGVPADILVKGMEGIPTQMPFLLRAMAMPAQILRKGIVVSPLYIGKQLFRDSLAAPIISGADFLPVIGALKELRGPAKRTLEKRGIVGGQQFKGTSEDLSMILRDMADDKPGWMSALGKLEAAGMEADALTRRAQYNSYIEQGLSEMEATLMALESMNFNKRGASPSIHVANALIPFFNAQIQGLNVMYKAMTGKMPFNDKLRIREKMLQRGALMAGITLAYAVHMEDDEAYQNATPDQKYGNWFVRVPGVDEPVRVPVPFEVGYIFKAIPEALYNSMTTEHGGEEAVQAFKQILLQTVPGGTSYGIPQFFKPAIEVGLGKSFYTGRDILSAKEQRELPEYQYRNNTTEAAKYVGSSLGISPIKLEALINGYTGTLGLAFMQAISLGVPVGESPEKAVKRLSEYPIVGGVFQPNDAGGIINAVYERMNEAEQVRTTVRNLMQDGKITEANALLERRGNEYMQAEISDVFKSNMNKLTQAERAINASDMSPQEKRAQLDEIRKMKIGLANAVREISDKTIHLSGFS